MKECELDLTEGSLGKKILIFSIPLMFSNVLQVLFNMADVAVVGKFVGGNALGSVGSTTTLIALHTGILIGIASGINILVALAIGSKKDKDIVDTVHTAAIISVLCGVVLMVGGIGLARIILEGLHTKPELITDAVLYFRIYLLGMPALALYNFGNAVFSAGGETKRPLIYLSISGVINVILNLFFVIVCQMSVCGVALASIVSQYLSAVLILRGLFFSDRQYALRKKDLKLNKKKALQILSVGLPAGMQNAIFYIANLFVQMGVNSFDTVLVAGNAAAANADNLVYDMMAAFYTACGSFMGQNYGAGKKGRMLKSYFICMFDAFFTALILGVLLTMFGRQFLSLFASDAAVIEAGMERLTVMGLSYCISAFMDNSIMAARSLGKSLVPMFIVIMGSCVFRVVWIYTVFAYFQTTTSLYLLYVFSWIITAIAGNIYFAKVYKEKTNAL